MRQVFYRICFLALLQIPAPASCRPYIMEGCREDDAEATTSEFERLLCIRRSTASSLLVNKQDGTRLPLKG